MQLGRFREFYQCDFDIAGNYGKSEKEGKILRRLSAVRSPPVLVWYLRELTTCCDLSGTVHDRLLEVPNGIG